MNYILIVFFLYPGIWPMGGYITSSQHGPFKDVIACESAGRQAELIAKEIGAQRVGTFCATTKQGDMKVRGERNGTIR